MNGKKAKRIRQEALFLANRHQEQINLAWASRPLYLRLWHLVRRVKKPAAVTYTNWKTFLKGTSS